MARHHLIDGVKVPFTAEEEAAYDKIKKECGIIVAKSPSIIGKTLFDKLSN